MLKSDAHETEYSYRIFLSYAHADADLVGKIANALEALGHQALWDLNIEAGTPFTESIKALIELSHLFIPIITKNSQTRPWVHQETGYAIALNIPVLPIAIGNQPAEMIASFQAIVVREDLSDLPLRLKEINLKKLVIPELIKPPGMIKLAEWPETRSELLMRYANWVFELGKYGHVCQIGHFTSFAIPNREIDDPLWLEWDGEQPRSDYAHRLLLEERRALEKHAREAGCSLIFYPESKFFSQRGLAVHRVHLQSFLEFVSNMPLDKVHVVIPPHPPEESLIIVGDYFSAEGLVSTLHGLRQTLFNCHPPSVLEKLEKFRHKFHDLGKKYGILDAQEVRGKIEYILESFEEN